MTKLTDTLKKVEATNNKLLTAFVSQINALEEANKVYRIEIIRLEGIVKAFIQVLAEKELKQNNEVKSE